MRKVSWRASTFINLEEFWVSFCCSKPETAPQGHFPELSEAPKRFSLPRGYEIEEF